MNAPFMDSSNETEAKVTLAFQLNCHECNERSHAYELRFLEDDDSEDKKHFLEPVLNQNLTTS